MATVLLLSISGMKTLPLIILVLAVLAPSIWVSTFPIDREESEPYVRLARQADETPGVSTGAEAGEGGTGNDAGTSEGEDYTDSNGGGSDSTGGDGGTVSNESQDTGGGVTSPSTSNGQSSGNGVGSSGGNVGGGRGNGGGASGRRGNGRREVIDVVETLEEIVVVEIDDKTVEDDQIVVIDGGWKQKSRLIRLFFSSFEINVFINIIAMSLDIPKMCAPSFRSNMIKLNSIKGSPPSASMVVKGTCH
ncbi:unnamed protein product [Hermetia illucens]|uniref:Uncharacterized protein n=1 Tax=Hermetia illucens TaxID=343691 RepID=A0A7R8YU74_HERIL|nr:unnamed protein product [Hermetia illucens]